MARGMLNGARMETAETPVSEPKPAVPGQTVTMPLGLLGFERIKEFVLIADPAEDPFLWLQAPGNSALAFLVVPPQPILPEYLPDIAPEDVTFLGADSASDLALLCIVTLRGPNHATLNLKGPIVLNKRTLVAKQVIPVNASEFSVQHPLPVA